MLHESLTVLTDYTENFIDKLLAVLNSLSRLHCAGRKFHSSSGDCCISVWRNCYQEFPVCVTPIRDINCWLIRLFEKTGTACNKHANGHNQFVWKMLSTQQ
jgi:hypothetical protein